MHRNKRERTSRENESRPVFEAAEGIKGIDVFENSLKRFLDGFKGKERELIEKSVMEIFKADEHGLFSTQESYLAIGKLFEQVENLANIETVRIEKIEPVEEPKPAQGIAWKENKKLTTGFFVSFVDEQKQIALVVKIHQASKEEENSVHSIRRFAPFGGEFVLVRREHLHVFE